jgi:hypothetical protein
MTRDCRGRREEHVGSRKWTRRQQGHSAGRTPWIRVGGRIPGNDNLTGLHMNGVMAAL